MREQVLSWLHENDFPKEASIYFFGLMALGVSLQLLFINSNGFWYHVGLHICTYALVVAVAVSPFVMWLIL